MFYKKHLILVFHVDDGLVMGNTKDVNIFMKELASEFEIRTTDGECFLGVQINCYKDRIEMNQTAYIDRLIAKYDMTDSNPLLIPIEQGWSPGDSKELGGTINIEKWLGVYYI